GADSTGHGVGYTVSACVRVGILSGAAADRRGAAGGDATCLSPPGEQRRLSMSRHVLKLPDPGEGTDAAEIIAWRVKPVEASLEVSSPVSGKVISTHGSLGESQPVGSELIVFETPDSGAARDKG